MANDELMRLAAKWRSENGDYPEAKRDCAGDLERVLAQRAPQHGAVPEGMLDLVEALDAAMVESLMGEGADIWKGNRGKLRNRLPENVGAILAKMRALLAAAPSPEAERAKGEAVDESLERTIRDINDDIMPPAGQPEGVEDCPLGDARWSARGGYLVYGTARVAQFDWESGYAAAGDLRARAEEWIARRLASAPKAVQPDGVEALAAIHGAMIRTLADIVNMHQTDKQCADEVISRPRVMECVIRAKQLLDMLSAHIQARRLASEQQHDTARLDYIERTFSGMTNCERYLPVQMIWGKGANGRTLREACDKYMARNADNSQENDHA